MAMRLAVDVGHAAVKVAADHRLFHFPAWIAIAPVTVDLGKLNGVSPEVTIAEDDNSPTSYWIGEEAAHLATPLWSEDKAADPMTRALIYEGLRRADLPDGPVAVAVGLPLSWYGTHHGALRDALLGRRVRVEVSNRRHTWQLTAVRVMPQGVAAAGAAVAQGLCEQPGTYLIVDVGYRTVDLVVVSVDAYGALHGHPELSDTIATGWHVVDEAVLRGLRQATGGHYRPSQVQGSSVVAYGKTLELARWREPGIHALADEVTLAGQTGLASIWPTLRAVVLVGGGGVGLAPAMEWGAVPVRVMTNAVYANALGFYEAIRDTPVPLSITRQWAQG